MHECVLSTVLKHQANSIYGADQIFIAISDKDIRFVMNNIRKCNKILNKNMAHLFDG